LYDFSVRRDRALILLRVFRRLERQSLPRGFLAPRLLYHFDGILLVELISLLSVSLGGIGLLLVEPISLDSRGAWDYMHKCVLHLRDSLHDGFQWDEADDREVAKYCVNKSLTTRCWRYLASKL
jgi:hypothetical protein